jgi:hypothetical protein
MLSCLSRTPPCLRERVTAFAVEYDQERANHARRLVDRPRKVG